MKDIDNFNIKKVCPAHLAIKAAVQFAPSTTNTIPAPYRPS